MLLASIIRTLSEEEIATFKKESRLPERSMLLFDRIANTPSSPPKSKDLCKELKITPENLYRIFSEIVSECIRILAPKEAFSVLEFYRRKYLYQPFLTELRRIEKELLRLKDRILLEAFYKYAFVNSSNFPTSQIDLDITQTYGEKWHRAKEDPPVDDDLYIATKIIYMRICAIPSRKKMTLKQMSEYAESLLSTIRKRALKSKNPLVRCVYYQSEWKSCMFDQHDIHKGILWLHSCLDVIHENRDKFNPDTEAQIELEIAYEQAMNMNKTSEGLEIFRKYYYNRSPDTPNGALFLQRYIRVAFLAGEFETAYDILKQFSAYHIVNATPQIHLMAIMMKIKLELVEGNLEDAMHSISLARAEMTENFFLAYELQLRGLETIFALKKNDLPYADKLARRNIKWLHLRRLSLSKSSWIHYYNMIGAIIDYKMASEPIRRSLMQHFMNDFRMENPEFYMLLEPEIAEATAINKTKRYR